MVQITVDHHKSYRFESNTVSCSIFPCVGHFTAYPTKRRTTESGPRGPCSESSRSSQCQSRSSSDETAPPPPCILRTILAAVLSTRERGGRS